MHMHRIRNTSGNMGRMEDSNMVDLLSEEQKRIIVDAFLEVAIGATVDSATAFLEDTNWQVDAAVKCFNLSKSQIDLACQTSSTQKSLSLKSSKLRKVSNKTFLNGLIGSSRYMKETLLLKLLLKPDTASSTTNHDFPAYTFVDEEGTKRRATVFVKQQLLFDRIFNQAQTYEITNAKAVQVPSRNAIYPREVQLRFTSKTVVTVPQTTIPPPLFIEKFLRLTDLKQMVDKEPYDFVAIVVRVDPLRQAPIELAGHSDDYCDIYVTDDRLLLGEKPLIIVNRYKLQILT